MCRQGRTACHGRGGLTFSNRQGDPFCRDIFQCRNRILVVGLNMLGGTVAVQNIAGDRNRPCPHQGGGRIKRDLVTGADIAIDLVSGIFQSRSNDIGIGNTVPVVICERPDDSEFRFWEL